MENHPKKQQKPPIQATHWEESEDFQYFSDFASSPQACDRPHSSLLVALVLIDPIPNFEVSGRGSGEVQLHVFGGLGFGRMSSRWWLRSEVPPLMTEI